VAQTQQTETNSIQIHNIDVVSVWWVVVVRTMPYVVVRESFLTGSCWVEGLPLTESKLLAERCQVFPDLREERHRRLEFNTSAVNILNSLEYLGYRVITSGSFVASQANNKKGSKHRFIQREFVWTVHRKSNDI